MKLDACLPAGLEAFAGAEIHEEGFLAVAAAYCRRLDLVGTVDRMVPTRMHLRPGLAVQAMVLDTLSGRSPLYRIEQFLAGEDAELLLGEKISPHDYNDTNIGRSVDAIFESGPSKIITEIGVAATKLFMLDTTTPSYDTTSTSVWGEYSACGLDTPPPGPVVTHGHSKDNLPGLKQFMTELLCVDRGVPIFGGVMDGNSSDKTSNNKLLSKISSIMARHGLGAGAFVYVADSAMVTEDNLKALGSNLFVSRLPATYSECSRAICEAVGADAWIELGTLAEHPSTKSRPCAEYKTHETSVSLYGKIYRAVVVHSSSHDKRRQKKLEKAITESAKAIAKELNTVQSVYFCEEDAIQAARQVEKLSGHLHSVSASIVPVQVKTRGRPPKNGSPPTATRYKLTCEILENAEGVEKERILAGCFVLLSNVPEEGDPLSMDSRRLLQTYKGQYGVESDFAFLKDPLVVNDIFLKKPSRIEVLGMVLILALMLWRLMERSMRNHVNNKDETLPGWDNKQTKKPTSFMMKVMMTGITVIITAEGRFLLRSPDQKQTEFLKALGLGPPVFTDPKYKCRPIIPEKNCSKK